jgi:cellulose biosynthesis protein BcsQ
MKIISVFSPKGGVAKTTATLHLADCLSTIFKKNVLVYDSDPQGSMYKSYYQCGKFSFDATAEFPTEIGQYDYIVVDYNPTVNFLTEHQRKLLKISDVVVSPTIVDKAAIESANALKQIVDPSKIINLFTMLDNQDPDERQLASKFPHFFVVHKSVVIKRAMRSCETIFQSKGNGKYIKRAREQYIDVVNHIEAIKSIR